MKGIEDLIKGMKAQTFGVEVEGNNAGCCRILRD